MIKEDEDLVIRLKEIIDNNGLDYQNQTPFQVYKTITESNCGERKIASAILYVLINGTIPNDVFRMSLEELSKRIQKECDLNRNISDRLASIFLSLYSENNEKEWKERENEGLKSFN